MGSIAPPQKIISHMCMRIRVQGKYYENILLGVGLILLTEFVGCPKNCML